jgi:hypothetical protein
MFRASFNLELFVVELGGSKTGGLYVVESGGRERGIGGYGQVTLGTAIAGAKLVDFQQGGVLAFVDFFRIGCWREAAVRGWA